MAASKITCEKCGRTMSEDNFYRDRSGKKMTMCKACLTMHVNNFKPETFLWILERIDVPYVEVEWNSVRDRVFAKNPKKMNGTSVLGKYLSKMRLSQFKDKRWADSDELNEEVKKRMELQKEQEEAYKANSEEFIQDIKDKYAAGEITEAEYKTYMNADALNKEYQAKKKLEQMQVIEGNKPVETLSPDIIGIDNYYNEANFMSENELVDVGADLTNEDKLYLAMKWGRFYKASEWVELEKKYTEMKNSFDIQDSDTEGSLILICKTYLKMNQAIDTGDMDGYQKLARVYSDLRKSAKFTAVQNKEANNNFLDAVGEIVLYCEEKGGQIPRHKITTPYDIVDTVISDMKEYTSSLVREDTALSRQIEDYLKRREIAEKREHDMKEAKENGLDYVEVTDKDYEEYFKEIEEQRAKDEEEARGLN